MRPRKSQLGCDVENVSRFKAKSVLTHPFPSPPVCDIGWSATVRGWSKRLAVWLAVPAMGACPLEQSWGGYGGACYKRKVDAKAGYPMTKGKLLHDTL